MSYYYFITWCYLYTIYFLLYSKIYISTSILTVFYTIIISSEWNIFNIIISEDFGIRIFTCLLFYLCLDLFIYLITLFELWIKCNFNIIQATNELHQSRKNIRDNWIPTLIVRYGFLTICVYYIMVMPQHDRFIQNHCDVIYSNLCYKYGVCTNGNCYCSNNITADVCNAYFTKYHECGKIADESVPVNSYLNNILYEQLRANMKKKEFKNCIREYLCNTTNHLTVFEKYIDVNLACK